MSGLIIPAKNQSKVSILEGPGAYPDDDDDDDDDDDETAKGAQHHC